MEQTIRLEPPSLDADSLRQVIEWQLLAGSSEVCGFCAVDQFGNQHLLRLANHAGEPDGFEISNSEVEVARDAASQRGWKIVAFVHTHPQHTAELSPRDARSFVRDTVAWIIVGTPTSRPHQRTYPPRVEHSG